MKEKTKLTQKQKQERKERTKRFLLKTLHGVSYVMSVLFIVLMIIVGVTSCNGSNTKTNFNNGKREPLNAMTLQNQNNGYDYLSYTFYRFYGASGGLLNNSSINDVTYDLEFTTLNDYTTEISALSYLEYLSYQVLVNSGYSSALEPYMLYKEYNGTDSIIYIADNSTIDYQQNNLYANFIDNDVTYTIHIDAINVHVSCYSYADGDTYLTLSFRSSEVDYFMDEYEIGLNNTNFRHSTYFNNINGYYPHLVDGYVQYFFTSPNPLIASNSIYQNPDNGNNYLYLPTSSSEDMRDIYLPRAVRLDCVLAMFFKNYFSLGYGVMPTQTITGTPIPGVTNNGNSYTNSDYNGLFGMFAQAFSGVTTIMSIELWAGFTLGTCMFLPLIVIILITVLKLLKR